MSFINWSMTGDRFLPKGNPNKKWVASKIVYRFWIFLCVYLYLLKCCWYSQGRWEGSFAGGCSGLTMPTKGVVIWRGEQGLPIFYQFSEKCRFEVSFANRCFLWGCHTFTTPSRRPWILTSWLCRTYILAQNPEQPSLAEQDKLVGLKDEIVTFPWTSFSSFTVSIFHS